MKMKTISLSWCKNEYEEDFKSFRATTLEAGVFKALHWLERTVNNIEVFSITHNKEILFTEEDFEELIQRIQEHQETNDGEYTDEQCTLFAIEEIYLNKN